MTGDHEKLISDIENKWLGVLFAQCKQNFSESHLPSHDETHHLRVWKYAKQVVNELSSKGIFITAGQLEQLIVSVFFHDQGMSVTHSKDHGRISRELCEKFFNTSALQPPAEFPNVLQAIDGHDDKDYCNTSTQPGFELQRILNISDDLDAFGIIGAYRYMEIYLLRGISVAELPDLVIANVDKRFRHFAEGFGENSRLVISQKSRYLAVISYYTDLKKQLQTGTNNGSTGALGAANYIHHEIVKRKRPLPDVCNEVIDTNNDSYCLQFFKTLLKEYSVI